MPVWLVLDRPCDKRQAFEAACPACGVAGVWVSAQPRADGPTVTVPVCACGATERLQEPLRAGASAVDVVQDPIR